ncbi:TlpA family protein disulfide reductase [Peptostreptococcus porci]|uniref:TlpA family protein disulfide reductase n=1 Tax=Peptostreptococcus porci TaxID=2652282 RepID=UPI0023F520C3|nr:TlpA disulfide reductase family protein [Peptostreptococcus porci]MDD7182123.1 TlpA disulfide reductase family protein [Peptostreptococcus porci]MDY5964004.1 TlpA disulfide reductase family protein [Peptostreptococcus porci]
MKMKKITSLMLCGLVVATLATGCSQNKGADKGTEGQTTASTTSGESEMFPKIDLKDTMGNKVDNSMFKNNKLTILNMWNTGCQSCIDEMPNLEKMNKNFEKMGAKIVGINYDIQNEPNQVKDIIKKQGVTYQNVIVNSSSNEEIRSYMEKIFAYPTTVFVNSEGKIVGQMEGTIDGPDRIKEIEKMIKDNSK